MSWIVAAGGVLILLGLELGRVVRDHRRERDGPRAYAAYSIHDPDRVLAIVEVHAGDPMPPPAEAATHTAGAVEQVAAE